MLLMLWISNWGVGVVLPLLILFLFRKCKIVYNPCQAIRKQSRYLKYMLILISALNVFSDFVCGNFLNFQTENGAI